MHILCDNLFCSCVKLFRELFLLLLFPLFLWLHSLQLTIPHQIDETSLLCYHTFDSICEINCWFTFVSEHRREIPNIANYRPRCHHHVEILHHWVTWTIPECITKTWIVLDCYRINYTCVEIKTKNLSKIKIKTRKFQIYSPPTSKLPFLNCITDVLLMHVPSGKINIGGFFGSETCCLRRAATADLSLASALSNQMCGEARANARCKTPRNPPCLWPICFSEINVNM